MRLVRSMFKQIGPCTKGSSCMEYALMLAVVTLLIGCAFPTVLSPVTNVVSRIQSAMKLETCKPLPGNFSCYVVNQ